MKTKQIFSLLLTVLVLTSSMVVAQTKAGSDKVVFDVNMHCEACQKKIEKNIAFEKGVKAMEVSLENKTVALNYDAKKTSPEKLQAALVKLGYTAKVKADNACCDKSTASADCQTKPASEVKGDCQTKAAGECKDKAKADCQTKPASEVKADCQSKAAGECKDKAKADCQTKPASEVKADCKAKAAGECKDKAKTDCTAVKKNV
jgi:copper chaperone CopZ